MICLGWRVSDGCGLACRVTVARPASPNAGRCWIFPGVEPGRISGSLARELAVLAAVVPYTLAARLADLLLGVKISPMGIWKVSQRLGQAVANYSEALSRYHADSRAKGAPTDEAPATVLLSVDGCTLGMQVRSHRC